ncbi:DNA replication/repair protein RecF [Howardella ureilytica]|nr:DNA replication/repair protein RecF [Lachnospiraceae bacterium]
MKIKEIELKDFRNYPYLKLELSDGINILYGSNAQGKSNILEAIYMCAAAKSYRGAKDKELLRFTDGLNQCDDAHIKLIVEKKYTSNRIDVHIKKSARKGIAVDKFPVKNLGELIGILNVVVFSPENLDIIRMGPAVRRDFIDSELISVSKIYYNNLVNFNKILDSRNKYLKNRDVHGNGDITLLDILDEQFVFYAKKIIKDRFVYIEKLSQIVSEIHYNITGGKESLRMEYNPNTRADELADKISENRQRDLKYGLTSFGPHRDDITFYINDMDVKVFGSQGQKRTAAISTKLAEISMIKEETGDDPVLLLDDVLSELDENRQKLLFSNIKNIQTVITCTGYDELNISDMSEGTIYEVNNGKVVKRSTL